MSINQLIMLLIEIILSIVALVLSIPIVVLFIECFAAILPDKKESTNSPESRPKVAILMPAHNEATVISQTLKTLLPQLKADDKLIAIADNCSDDTAKIARELGATAIERQDSERRGKGYALDYGLKFIETEPPEAVILVDADCICQPDSIDQIAHLAVAENRPVQALYLMEQPPKPGPRDAVSGLAFMVKNLVRPRGLNRLGLPCLLTGTGMAFPWSVIRQASLASGNIVEDLQLGLDLAIAGHAPRFCGDAKVTGILPQQQEAAKSQRTRWEHGYLQTLFAQVPQMLTAGLTQKRFDLFALGLELCVPPLSFLVMIWAGGAIVALSAMIIGASSLPALIFAIQGLLIFLSIVAAWAKFGRESLPAVTLLAVPLYLLWKIPLYLAFLFKPQTKWVRTERDAVDSPD
jgi:cellulose synthase/poly-beta-1,6-N-acetylglucosamine synthase-like glycosyltransferase